MHEQTVRYTHYTTNSIWSTGTENTSVHIKSLSAIVYWLKNCVILIEALCYIDWSFWHRIFLLFLFALQIYCSTELVTLLLGYWWLVKMVMRNIWKCSITGIWKSQNIFYHFMSLVTATISSCMESYMGKKCIYEMILIYVHVVNTTQIFFPCQSSISSFACIPHIP